MSSPAITTLITFFSPWPASSFAQNYFMRKLLLATFAAAAIFAGCKKKDNNNNNNSALATTPTALAANDHSSKGIYKGVLIGSSGTISFDVMNGGNTLTAKMTIDGTVVNLAADIAWASGQPVVAPFTGTMNGSPVSITFTIAATGDSPMVMSATIPGHPNATFDIIKETSTSLVMCYEGTYHTTKPEDGTFNIIVSKAARIWGGIARENGTNDAEKVGGVVTTDNKLTDDAGTRTMGTISSDNINGSFQDSGNNTVTVTGHRTL